jgi:dihydrofolate reductase
MKVFILAAVTADGLIARDGNHFPDWTSPEDTALFVKLTKEAGTMVMGSRTLKALQERGRRLPKRRIIVYTRDPASISGERVEPTSENPHDLVKRLEAEGIERLAICGGATIHDLFIEAGLVDELYITVEPLLFGSGLGLFNKSLGVRLELLDTQKIGDQAVLLHYKVLKQS